jgi:ABC-type glycerol-3-phosphate transport system substrate-binding protein
MDNVKEGERLRRVADRRYLRPTRRENPQQSSGSNVAISNQTKNPATAAAYALYTCASNEGQIEMANMGTFPSFYPAYEDPGMRDATAGVYGDQKFNQPFIALSSKVPNTYWRDSAFPQADVIVNAGLVNIHNKKWTPEEGVKAMANQIRAATLRP